jgi:hypothetical protein
MTPMDAYARLAAPRRRPPHADPGAGRGALWLAILLVVLAFGVALVLPLGPKQAVGTLLSDTRGAAEQQP